MSLQTRRKFIKNIEAKVLPFSILGLLIAVSLSAVFVFNPNIESIKAGSISDFDNYIELTIDHTKITGTLTNHPVLVYNSSWVSGINSTSFSFFNSTDEDAVELDWELVNYDSGNGELEAYVSLPSISSSVDTSFYLYYDDNSSIDGGENDASNVWDSNYAAVYHLDGANAAGVDDSTGKNDIEGDNGDPVYQQSGIVGECVQFDGTGDNLECGDHADWDTMNSVFTIEFWFKGVASQAYWFYRYNSWYIRWNDDNTYRVYSYSSDIVSSTEELGDNVWHYVVGVKTGSGDDTMILYNTTLENTTSNDGAQTASGSAVYMGSKNDASDSFNGYMDEVRLSKVERSRDYMNATYYNINSPSSFLSWGNSISTYVEGSYTHSIVNNTGFTWEGEVDENPWANSTGDYYETGVIYTNTSGTNDSVDLICLDFTDFTSDIVQENLSVCFINTTDGSFSSITSYTSIPAVDGNFSLNSSQWSTGVGAGWADGTNPFTISSFNSTIQYRLRCAIPSDASTGTFTNNGLWYILWNVTTT